MQRTRNGEGRGKRRDKGKEIKGWRKEKWMKRTGKGERRRKRWNKSNEVKGWRREKMDEKY